MGLSRREFLKLMGGASAALAFPGVMIQGVQKALADAVKRTPVIWIQAQSCSGCSVSLLNKTDPDIASVITQHISLNFHQTIMAGTGDVAIGVLKEAVGKNRKDFVLIVEGSIPTKSDEYCTIGRIDGKMVAARQWVEQLGKNAKAVVAVGTCSAYGGIPAARNSRTGARPLSGILSRADIINVPGCPPHPDWMVGSLLHVLLKGKPDLDEYQRPLLFFGKTVHEQCDRLKYYEQGKFAENWGDEGCLYHLGCLGMDTNCDIPARKWVDGANSCTECGAGCIGCTEDVFPDYGNRGIFKHLKANADELKRLHPDTQKLILKLQAGEVIHG